MAGKYEEELLDAAQKLDLQLNRNAVFYQYSINLIQNNDENTIREILQEISMLKAANVTKDTLQLMMLLKDKLVSYCGYVRIKAVYNRGFSPKDDTDNNYTLAELQQELNELVGLDAVKSKVNDLIAGYQGQTALKVKKVIERAKGGVLFIDEAYSITENEHSDSYGRECLTELTKALEDYRNNLVVIVAGYTEPMKNFFESNPGLKSRFNTFIEFPDYTAFELMEILYNMCLKNDYMLTPTAKEKLQDILIAKVAYKNDEFANGRLVRNIYDDIIMNQARRLINVDNPTKGELMQILDEDVSY